MPTPPRSKAWALTLRGIIVLLLVGLVWEGFMYTLAMFWARSIGPALIVLLLTCGLSWLLEMELKAMRRIWRGDQTLGGPGRTAAVLAGVVAIWLVLFLLMCLPYFVRPFRTQQAWNPQASYDSAMANDVSRAYPDLIQHFPGSAPAGAKLVRFYFWTGFGTRWAARYEGQDAGFLESLRQRFPGSSPQDPDPGQFVWSWAAPQLDITDAPDKYDSVILNRRDGNHGHLAGLSLSKQGNVALFWADRW